MDGLCGFCRAFNIELLCTDSGHDFYATWEEVEESAKRCRFCKFLTSFSTYLTKDGQIHMIMDDHWAPAVSKFFNSMQSYQTVTEYCRPLKDEVTSTLQGLRPGRLYALDMPSLGGMGLLLYAKDKIAYFRLTTEENPGLLKLPTKERQLILVANIS